MASDTEILQGILDELKALRTDMNAQMRAFPAATAPTRAPSGAAVATGGTVDPNACFGAYGRSKGMPVRGAAMGDLEYYAEGCRRTLADPAKARFHGKERDLLASIEAEIQRHHSGGGGTAPNPSDEFGPAPTDYDNDVPFITCEGSR